MVALEVRRRRQRRATIARMMRRKEPTMTEGMSLAWNWALELRLRGGGGQWAETREELRNARVVGFGND